MVNLFFFLDEKETKNQDLGFSAIKIGLLPKTQKLGLRLRQFEFLHGSFSFLILACQILWSEKSSGALLWLLEFGISILAPKRRDYNSCIRGKTSRFQLPTSNSLLAATNHLYKLL
jgi:hypothetical protein